MVTVKQNLEAMPITYKTYLQDAVREAVNKYRKEYEPSAHFTRKRKLTIGKMADILLSADGGSISKVLRTAGVDATASAFVQQRDKIPHTVFEDAMEIFNAKCAREDEYYEKQQNTYKGYRVLAVDGTAVNIARNPKSESYMKHSGTPKGYNQLHVTPLFDVLNKQYEHCVIQPQPKQDEVGALLFMLSFYTFKERTLLVCDRGFESYNVLAHCIRKRVEAREPVYCLIRVKDGKNAMRVISDLPMKELDRDVTCTITTTQTNEDKAKNYIFIQTHRNENREYSPNTRAGRWDHPSPYTMKFRVVRVKLSTGNYETLVTTLPRSITAAQIKELYHARWGVENAFRELKYSLGLVNLHGKKDEFAKQEIFASMLMSNFCHRIVNEIVIHRNPNNKYLYAVNMTQAVSLCKEYYRKEEEPRKCYVNGKRLLYDILKQTVPIRPERQNERNLKAKTFYGFFYRVPA